MDNLEVFSFRTLAPEDVALAKSICDQSARCAMIMNRVPRSNLKKRALSRLHEAQMLAIEALRHHSPHKSERIEDLFAAQ